MLKTLVGAFKNKDIRKKILYTLMILVIVRVGSLLPIPGVDTSRQCCNKRTDSADWLYVKGRRNLINKSDKEVQRWIYLI